MIFFLSSKNKMNKPMWWDNKWGYHSISHFKSLIWNLMIIIRANMIDW